jgi:hypothetical protein
LRFLVQFRGKSNHSASGFPARCSLPLEFLCILSLCHFLRP